MTLKTKQDYERYIRNRIEDADLKSVLETDIKWFGGEKPPNFSALNKGTLVFLSDVLEQYERMLRFVKASKCPYSGSHFKGVDDLHYHKEGDVWVTEAVGDEIFRETHRPCPKCEMYFENGTTEKVGDLFVVFADAYCDADAFPQPGIWKIMDDLYRGGDMLSEYLYEKAVERVSESTEGLTNHEGTPASHFCEACNVDLHTINAKAEVLL
jgi:hypothetical protein